MKPTAPYILSALITASVVGHAATRADAEALFKLVLNGTKCQQFAGGAVAEWRCEYQVGTLRFAIKDEGGGVYNIPFFHSDFNQDYWAVMYGGCVSIQYGMKMPAGGPVVYVAPVNGRVYRELDECQAARRPK